MSKPHDLELLAKQLAEQLGSTEALLSFTNTLQKHTLEAVLNTEMDVHLEATKPVKKNSRNGYSKKTLKTHDDQFELSTPRDRQGDFEPQLIKKRQTRLESIDSAILNLYAKGMSTREIASLMNELYDADVSPQWVSRVTDAMKGHIVEWQSRPLEGCYAIVYLDCIVVKIRQDQRVTNKAIYIALGVDLDGQKDVLGLWVSENEGAKFWLSVLTELNNRGVKDILIMMMQQRKSSF